jgi:hypothetical protein
MKNSLQLEEVGSNFILHRTDDAGKTTEIELSEDNILTLARSLPDLADRLLAARTQTGAVAVSVTEVAQIGLNLDVHASEIFLSLFDRHGAERKFSLRPEFARHLVDRLPHWLDKMDQASKTKQ